MSIVEFGNVVKDVKVNIDRQNNPYKYYVAGDHMDSNDMHINKKGLFATDDVGPAFIRRFIPGQILYGSRRTYLKKVAVADFEGICANTTFVFESKDNNIFDQRLLPFIMLSDDFTEYSISKSKGSTNPYILFSDLAKYKFELPNIDKQKQLAELLCAAEVTRQAYKTIIRKTDDLLKATFSYMFKNTKKEKIGEVCEIKARIGWQGLKKKEYLTTGDYHLVTGVDFVNNRIDFDHCYYVTFERYQQDENIQLKENDVLLTKDGTIGKVAYVDKLNMPATLNSGIFVLRDKYDKLESLFLYYCLMTDDFNAFVNGFKTGSTIPHLNQSALINYEIPMPSKVEQNQYIDFAQSIELYNSSTVLALNKLNRFISSIVNENFSKGGLHV